MKKNKQLNKNKLPILFVMLGVFIIGQLIFNVYTDNRVSKIYDSGTITDLIFAAVDGLHKPAPVEASTGKVYFPDARLVLPASDPFMQIQYSNVGDKTTPELQVTTRALVNQSKSKLLSEESILPYDKKIEAVYSAVPSLQACARGVQILYSKSTSGLNLKYTKTLSNGKNIYFYTESTCKLDLGDLLNYLKQIQSY